MWYTQPSEVWRSDACTGRKIIILHLTILNPSGPALGQTSFYIPDSFVISGLTSLIATYVVPQSSTDLDVKKPQRIF